MSIPVDWPMGGCKTWLKGKSAEGGGWPIVPPLVPG